LASGVSAEEIRKDIAGDASRDPAMHSFRAEIQRQFDALVSRLNVAELGRGRIRFLRVASQQLSPTLQAEIVKRLLARQTIEQVARDLRLSISAVRRLSRKHKTAFRKPGHGRRYSVATIAAMTTELKAGVRPTDVCARYGCTMEFTKKIRRQFGDTFDRRDLRLVNPKICQKVKQALAAGQRPTEIERTFRFSHSWLWHFRKHVLHDTEDLRLRPLIIPETEREQIAAELRAGGSIRALARKFHHAYRAIKEIGFAVGWAPRKCRKFTDRERTLIIELIAQGKSNREIAKAVQCSTVAIQQARLRSQWTLREALVGWAPAWE
jgi:DNA-directed RNA polymerase specialized sigma24 family protein